MKNPLSQGLMAVILMSLAAAADAQQAARAQLEQFARGLDTFAAQFEQRVVGTDGAVEDESEGSVWLSQPHFIRWEYGGEFPELVVADGEQIWIYDEMLEQVTVKPQSEFAGDSPLSVISNIDRLDEQFEVREAGDLDGLLLLELRSSNPEAEFERVILGLQDNELRLMTMEDNFGLRTEIHFRELERNTPLDVSLFSFTPPPGVDVLGAAEAGED